MERHFRNIIGSLNALLVLEAAVRHGNFTKAGKELSLSQPTVSRHVATLEARIGKLLFQRRNNRIRPTGVAKALADAVSLGLGHAESVWESVAERGRRRDLILACSFTFAENWLLPRFSGLRRELGDRTIRIATFDWMEGLDDERADLAVVWGRERVPGRSRLPLFSEEAFPVCSPDHLRRHPRIGSSPEALLDAKLLHLDVGDSELLTWRKWFSAQGIEARRPPAGPLFDSYPFLLRAVQDGEGVGLGWRHLADRFIDNGSLVRVGPGVVNGDAAYQLQYREYGVDSETVMRIVSWFRQMVDEQNSCNSQDG